MYQPCLAKTATLTSFVFLIPRPPSDLGLQISFHPIFVQWWVVFIPLCHYSRNISICPIYIMTHKFMNFEPIHGKLKDTCEILFDKNDFTCIQKNSILSSHKLHHILFLISSKSALVLWGLTFEQPKYSLMLLVGIWKISEIFYLSALLRPFQNLIFICGNKSLDQKSCNNDPIYI